MRRIQLLIPEDGLETVTEALGDEGWLVEFPVPTDAVGHVFDRLEDADVDLERYSTVASLETATTPEMEALEERFADDFDPLTRSELRSKARDLAATRSRFSR